VSPCFLTLHGLGAGAAPVAADMKKMNENLLSVVGDRHPMLMAAAEQIFGAGGKKLRPMLVFLVAHSTAQAAGLTCVGPPAAWPSGRSGGGGVITGSST
jgi:hypothetical protein